MKTRLLMLTALTSLMLSLPGKATLITLEATIDGSQSGTNSSAMAHANITLNTETLYLDWAISKITPFFTSTVNFAHFHGPASLGSNGGVQLWLCDNAGAGPDGTSACGGDGDIFSSGSAMINDDQKMDLLGGLWYINIHTEAFAPGEIRGQVTHVSEPGILSLFGFGLMLLLIARRNWR